MQLFRDRHRVVGANLLNEEFEAFAEIARREGLAPGVLAARLLREEIAKNAAPSVVPDIEERFVHA